MTWISVKDRLPPLYTDVQVIDIYGNQSVGRYVGHGEFTHHKYPVAGQVEVTHWMPLPEPPESTKVEPIRKAK